MKAPVMQLVDRRAMWLTIWTLTAIIVALFASLWSVTALAQTLTPAEPPTDWKGYGVWLLITLVVVLIVLLIKHNPISVASLRTSIENLTHSHKTLTEKHAELVETHAEAVATIPKALAATPPPVLPTWVK